MKGRFPVAVCFALIAAIVVGGCEQRQQEEVEVLDIAPDIAMLSVSSDYAGAAIESAGGLDAWSKTREMQLDCVVTCYEADGSSYLTEQHIDIYPWSGSIRISGKEPQGEYAWQLSSGQIKSLQGDESTFGLPSGVGRRCFADLVLNIVTVPARLMDKSVEFNRNESPIKLQGRWYYAVDRKNKQGGESVQPSAEATFYQDREKSIFDMIRLSCRGGQKFLLVCGYDYRKVEKDGVSVPSKIEIFNCDADGGQKDRLVKIDCHDIRKAK